MPVLVDVVAVAAMDLLPAPPNLSVPLPIEPLADPVAVLPKSAGQLLTGLPVVVIHFAHPILGLDQPQPHAVVVAW